MPAERIADWLVLVALLALEPGSALAVVLMSAADQPGSTRREAGRGASQDATVPADAAESGACPRPWLPDGSSRKHRTRPHCSVRSRCLSLYRRPAQAADTGRMRPPRWTPARSRPAARSSISCADEAAS